jgi:chromosome segregation ATPase
LEAALAAAAERNSQEQSERVAELEAQAEALRARVDEVTAVAAALTDELASLREAQTETESEAATLRARVDELATAVVDAEQTAVSLRTELDGERARSHRLIADAAAMDELLKKERQSAAEVMELLSRAATKFNGAPTPVA